MQIIIDIDEDDYEFVKEQVDTEYCNNVRQINNRLYQIIANGTVLSKGHWIQQPRCEGDEQPDLVCPNCGFKISWWDIGNFCAKCGKGLEGGAE